MEKKIIPNRCDRNGNPYITVKDVLGSSIYYDNDGKFQYLQDNKGNQYTIGGLKNMKMDLSLKLIDPTAPISENNILAKDHDKQKSVEIEVKQDPEIESCIRSNQEVLSIDTMRHGCNIQKLFSTDDAIKINLKDGAELNKEFAQLSGTVNFMNKYQWIDLGLNEYELSKYRVKITNDCAKEEEIKERDACEPDIAAIRNHRDDVIVKSKQSDEKVGSINLSSWFFKNDELYYDLRGDKVGARKVGKDNVYLKVLPCDEQKPYYKLTLCDQDGNIATRAQEDEAVIDISKCNFIDGQKIQLKDYIREDSLPSFTIKPSESKARGESYGDRSRAKVYEYDPISHDIGNEVGKLNATDIRVSGETFIIDNQLLDNRYTAFSILDIATIITEEDGLYNMSKPFYHNGKPANAETTKLLLDDLLCLYDHDSLQDGVQIIG